MFLKDDLYGDFEVSEPVLLEVLNCPTLNRLKGISLGGYYPAHPDNSTSRFSHSVGVFLLLRKFGARIEEQIAGLIHDVSHSAFSHTIDYINENAGGQTQEGQDSIHHSFVKNSKIASILENYGFDVDYILDDNNFTLKENSLPDICADRIDYSLRDALLNGIITAQVKDNIINSLVCKDGSFVFRDFKNAKIFTDAFWKLDEDYYSGMRSAVMLGLGGMFLQIALKKSYITHSALYEYGNDTIIGMITPHLKHDVELKEVCDNLHLPVDSYANNPSNYIRKVFCKVRRVDPKFIDGDRLLRVTDVDLEYKKRLEKVGKFEEYFISKRD